MFFWLSFFFFFFCPSIIKAYYTAVVKESVSTVLLTLFEKIDFPCQIYSASYQSFGGGESLAGATISLPFSSFESNVNWARNLIA